ncbi:RodZ family helix-turn-helix domain-containing protein [Cysteiniphilum halobium]|uniref:hypothetical protein n=1 Tax=Cysteiniphilum halobium TaxID=2219059 RepID=UPI000E648D96|nr:hypothetical protein [Cysteiniphilum halobium]
MNSFQQQLKHLRKEQQLTIDGVASKMSFTAQTIQMLEDTDDLFSLELPTQSLKNYYRKYGECLGMPERKIVSMLNRIDYLNYKRSRKGKMKPFDYLNRLVILALVVWLGHTVYTLYQQQKANALKQSVVTLSAPVISNPSHQISPNISTNDNQTETIHPPTSTTVTANTNISSTKQSLDTTASTNTPAIANTVSTNTTENQTEQQNAQ